MAWNVVVWNAISSRHFVTEYALPEIQADQADLARQYSPVDKKIQTGVN